MCSEELLNASSIYLAVKSAYWHGSWLKRDLRLKRCGLCLIGVEVDIAKPNILALIHLFCAVARYIMAQTLMHILEKKFEKMNALIKESLFHLRTSLHTISGTGCTNR